MHELFVKLMQGDATDIEVRQLNRWRAESANHETEFQNLVRLWDVTGVETHPGPKRTPSTEDLMREGDRRRMWQRVRGGGRAMLWSPVTAYSVTSAALAALVVFVAMKGGGDRTMHERLMPTATSSSTTHATTTVLSDGSIVRTQRGSRVGFPSASNRREIELEGRAFFAVVPDDRPFVVRTSIGQVTVEGTRFEVATEGEWPRVVVVEGKVRLDTPGGRVEVRQGQVAYWSAGHAPVVTDHEDVWSVLEWHDGLLVFQATPLSTVAYELERHFGLHVQVNDRASGDIRITAWFEDEPFDEVMSAVCLAAGVKCDIHDAGAVIGD